jgi:hypothetical protein
LPELHISTVSRSLRDWKSDGSAVLVKDPNTKRRIAARYKILEALEQSDTGFTFTELLEESHVSRSTLPARLRELIDQQAITAQLDAKSGEQRYHLNKSEPIPIAAVGISLGHKPVGGPFRLVPQPGRGRFQDPAKFGLTQDGQEILRQLSLTNQEGSPANRYDLIDKLLWDGIRANRQFSDLDPESIMRHAHQTGQNIRGMFPTLKPKELEKRMNLLEQVGENTTTEVIVLPKTQEDS